MLHASFLLDTKGANCSSLPPSAAGTAEISAASQLQNGDLCDAVTSGLAAWQVSANIHTGNGLDDVAGHLGKHKHAAIFTTSKLCSIPQCPAVDQLASS